MDVDSRTESEASTASVQSLASAIITKPAANTSTTTTTNTTLPPPTTKTNDLAPFHNTTATTNNNTTTTNNNTTNTITNNTTNTTTTNGSNVPPPPPPPTYAPPRADPPTLAPQAHTEQPRRVRRELPPPPPATRITQQAMFDSMSEPKRKKRKKERGVSDKPPAFWIFLDPATHNEEAWNLQSPNEKETLKTKYGKMSIPKPRMTPEQFRLWSELPRGDATAKRGYYEQHFPDKLRYLIEADQKKEPDDGQAMEVGGCVDDGNDNGDDGANVDNVGSHIVIGNVATYDNNNEEGEVDKVPTSSATPPLAALVDIVANAKPTPLKTATKADKKAGKYIRLLPPKTEEATKVRLEGLTPQKARSAFYVAMEKAADLVQWANLLSHKITGPPVSAALLVAGCNTDKILNAADRKSTDFNNDSKMQRLTGMGDPATFDCLVGRFHACITRDDVPLSSGVTTSMSTPGTAEADRFYFDKANYKLLHTSEEFGRRIKHRRPRRSTDGDDRKSNDDDNNDNNDDNNDDNDDDGNNDNNDNNNNGNNTENNNDDDNNNNNNNNSDTQPNKPDGQPNNANSNTTTSSVKDDRPINNNTTTTITNNNNNNNTNNNDNTNNNNDNTNNLNTDTDTTANTNHNTNTETQTNTNTNTIANTTTDTHVSAGLGAEPPQRADIGPASPRSPIDIDDNPQLPM